MDITINKGDALTVEETISGLDSLSGFAARMYIVTNRREEVDIIEGTIEGLKVYYEFLNDPTKAYPVGKHKFETKIFNSSDLVYTINKGNFTVTAVIEDDPV